MNYPENQTRSFSFKFDTDANLNCDITAPPSKPTCIDEVISKLTSVPASSKNFQALRDSDVSEILRYFLSVFCISDINDYMDKDINAQISQLENILDRCRDEYKKELCITLNAIFTILDLLNHNKNGTFTISNFGSLKWQSSHCTPIYAPCSSTMLKNDLSCINTNNTNLARLIKQYQEYSFTIAKMPEIITPLPFDDPCIGLRETDGALNYNMILSKKILGQRTFELVTGLMDIIDKYSIYKPLKLTGFGRVNNKSVECNPVATPDECDDTMSFSENKYESVKYVGYTAQNVSLGYQEILHLIMKYISDVSVYDKTINKTYKLIEFFSRSLTKNMNVSFKNIIVMCIDIKFIEFVHYFLIDKLKIDLSDIFSIEKIIFNMTKYYMEYSNADKRYLTINVQEDDIRSTLMLYVSIVTNILSDSKTYKVPIHMLNSISMPIFIGMTMRSTIICPNQDILHTILKRLIELTKVSDQSIFSYEYKTENNVQNVLVRDEFGCSFTMTIDPTLTNEIVCNRD